MASEAAVSILVCLIGAIIFYGPWQWVCTDWMRQVCFEARDKIFDIAAEGRLAFSSPEYRSIRQSIESEIRFAHRLTLPYLAVVGIGLDLLRPQVVKNTKLHEAEMRSRISDRDTRNEVENILYVMNKKVILIAMAKSPVLVVLPLAIMVPVMMCFAAAKAYVRVLAGTASTAILITSSLGDEEGIVSRESWSVQ